MHHVSKYVIQYCIQNNIGKIVIGKNDNWKQKINIGKRNNQNFVNIPFDTLIQQIQYKSEMVGIDVITREESYTSICSAFDLEKIGKHIKYAGKRIKRGLFETKNKFIVNADVNGALNILRKEIGNDFILGLNRGDAASPIRVNPLINMPLASLPK
jgi:putative transposase